MVHHNGEVSGIERNKTHIFSGHGVARIEKFSRIFLPPIGLIFGPLLHTLWLKSTRPPQRARRGVGELKCGGPAAGGGRRKKMDPGRVRGFFETGIFVGKGYENFYRRNIRR